MNVALQGSALAPAGPAAESPATLTWLLVGLVGIVYALVVALIVVAARHRRRRDLAPALRAPTVWRPPAWCRAGSSSGVVITGVLVASLPVLHGLRESK